MKNKNVFKKIESSKLANLWRDLYRYQTRIRDLEQIVALQQELLNARYADLSKATAVSLKDLRKK